MLRRIPRQSVLSDYVCEVEEKTGKDAECYAIRLKEITEVAFRKWTRRTQRTLCCTGLLTFKLDEHRNLIEILIKIKLRTISTLSIYCNPPLVVGHPRKLTAAPRWA